MVYEYKKLGVFPVNFHCGHFQVKVFSSFLYFSDISENTRQKVTLMVDFVGL